MLNGTLYASNACHTILIDGRIDKQKHIKTHPVTPLMYMEMNEVNENHY